MLSALLVAATVTMVNQNAATADGEQADALTLTALSSRAQVVSGGDALIRVNLPDSVSAADVQVDLDGTDVTENFQPVGDGQRLLGLVDGLADGANQLTASAPDVDPGELELTSHPITGPVFSGPHEQPFLCGTQDFETVTGELLGEPLDENCSAETRFDYMYRTTAGEWAVLPADDNRPGDLAFTTISTGEEVPYIVRVETGTINRAIYETAILHDPETADPDPWNRSGSWNDRLVYRFGGGCPGGWYRQGSGTAGVMDDGMLRQGYAVASASLNVFGTNCNDLLAAETMSMVKERFVEAYGRPAFTLGWGSSGGSYQNHQIGDNYPGLLDGVVSGASFPDVAFGTAQNASDASLLQHFFDDVAPDSFSQEQQRAVTGFGKWESIAKMASAGLRIDPRQNCDHLPEADRYDPENNPDGARCDVYDHTVNVYGSDPETGFARRPLDNTGIQYGLQALNNETIDVDQFLDLNEGIGGFDQDANVVADRTEADLEATREAYRTGRLLNGGAGLARMPMIDYRGYQDDASSGDIHMRFQGFSTRERLEQANGTFENQVMLTHDGRDGGFSTENPILLDALAQMDQWVSGIKADGADGTPAEKVLRNKPAELTEACWTRDDTQEKVVETQEPGNGTTTCNTLYPVWTSPRIVAGGPLANDIVKCQLRPVDEADYDVPFTEAQLERLRAIFPDGLCDWSKPGVEQQDLAGTWLSFGSG